ncbi:MAG: 4Fe-4S dicluster domain-containing protein, partial [Candidatus Stahlbacteria bacterium]|nr:4Fe-4S dicluster domain-containing protein [Candidatus Stahlbacteria bacterium]
GICIDFCPKKVFNAANKINPRGYYQPAINNPDACVGCGLCELLCPDMAIVVTEL